MERYVFKPVINSIRYDTPVNHNNDFLQSHTKIGELFTVKY